MTDDTGGVVTRHCGSVPPHDEHHYDIATGVAYCRGRQVMGDLLPEQMTDCLDCAVLAPEKCAAHGVHEGHKLRLQAYAEKDGTHSHRYFCRTCHVWAWVTP